MNFLNKVIHFHCPRVYLENKVAPRASCSLVKLYLSFTYNYPRHIYSIYNEHECDFEFHTILTSKLTSKLWRYSQDELYFFVCTLNLIYKRIANNEADRLPKITSSIYR